jgi:hypothetical protein
LLRYWPLWLQANYLQRDAVAAGGHSEAQETALRKFGADDDQGEKGEERGGTFEFVEAKAGQAQAIVTAGKEAQQNRPLLHIGKAAEREAAGQADDDINSEAECGHAWAKQPETLAEALAFGSGNAARRPERSDQILQRQEEQWRRYKGPAGKEGRCNQGAKAANGVYDNPFDHSVTVADFIEHNDADLFSFIACLILI